MAESKNSAFIRKWMSSNEEQKDEYLIKAKHMNQQNKSSIQGIFLKNIYLEEYDTELNKTKTHFNIVGPIKHFKEFSEKERIVLENRGLIVPMYKTIGDYTFNWRAFKKWKVVVYGGDENDKSTWWYLLENCKCNVGNFTFIHKKQETVCMKNYC